VAVIDSTSLAVIGATLSSTLASVNIGNSGGGIFDARTHELIGIFAKIYNHGNLRPTIVPHMGLVVPLDEVYTWLAGEGYTIVDDGDTRRLAKVGGEVSKSVAMTGAAH